MAQHGARADRAGIVAGLDPLAGGVHQGLDQAFGQAGRRAGGRIEILNGLSGDERVAATNAFLLKAELAKGEAEHGH